jgi:hypothetical protein
MAQAMALFVTYVEESWAEPEKRSEAAAGHRRRDVGLSQCVWSVAHEKGGLG